MRMVVGFRKGYLHVRTNEYGTLVKAIALLSGFGRKLVHNVFKNSFQDV